VRSGFLILVMVGCRPEPVGPTPSSSQEVDSAADTSASASGGDSAEPGDEVEQVPGVDDPGPGDPSLLCTVELSCDDAVADEPKQGCSLAIVSGDEIALYDGAAGVELRGRSSLAFPKPQYGVELRAWIADVLPMGSTWRYKDDGLFPGADWVQPDFDDSAWASGPAPLGYGDTVTTEVSYGPDSADKHPTTWFRTTFSYDPATLPAGPVDQLLVSVLRDDGAAVYLNGTEILRSHLDEDAGPGDYATETIGGDDETTPAAASFDAGLLEEGENTLAVEVHQVGPTSSDIRMDLALVASGEEVEVDLLGMGAESDWILNGAYIDRALFRNKLLYDLFSSFQAVDTATGPLAPGSRTAAEAAFCTLSLNGEDQGIYVLTEKLKRDGSRLDLSADDGTGQSFILKLDDRSGFHESAVSYGSWRAVYPRETDENAEALEAISAHLSRWEAAHADPADPEDGIFAYVDLDSAVDFVILEELAKNNDAYFLSVHLWRDAGGLIHFVPWDMDLTFGYPYYDCSAEGWVGRQDYIDAMAQVPAFTERLEARWWELRGTVLTEDALLAAVDAAVDTTAPAIEANVALWPVDQIAFSWGGVENWLCPVDSYEEELERVREFLPARLVWMDENIGSF